MNKVEIIKTALDLVGGDRDEAYGDPVEMYGRVAAMYSAYKGQEMTARDAGMFMVLLKIARTNTGPHKDDDYVDIAGYAGVVGEIAARLLGVPAVGLAGDTVAFLSERLKEKSDDMP